MADADMADVDAANSSAVSEDEVEDQQDDEPSLNKSGSAISAVGEIIEGKRAKKTVERLDFQGPKQQEKLKIGDGSGDKLGDIPRTGYQINKMKPADLKPLHAILFDRPGKMSSIKKNLRLFNGFPFHADSEQYSRKREKLLKSSNLTNSKLKVVCTVLDLEKKGTHLDLIDRILTFLIAPKNSGKRVPVKKKRKSKKKLSGDDSKTTSKKKSRPKAKTASSPKKSRAGSKSKAIVMDSSSDEEEEEEEEKAGASAEASDTEEKPSEKEEEEEEESDKSEEDEESSKKSSREKKKSAVPLKRPRAPTKKTGPPNKRRKQLDSDESESDEKPKKKKPAAKTKMADSSSSRNNANTAAEDSSDEDEPLIRMVKKPPSEDQLKETVQSLLKEADLEEMTMKRICQMVFDTYPEHDLSSKKDFIKQTVKSLIT